MPTSVMPMTNFAWVENPSAGLTLDKASRLERDLTHDGKCITHIEPRGKTLMHPDGPLLVRYAQNGCPVDVGRPWTAKQKMTASEQGHHKSALAPDAITMMYTGVAEKVKDDLVKVVYLDEIKHLLDTLELKE